LVGKFVETYKLNQLDALAQEEARESGDEPDQGHHHPSVPNGRVLVLSLDMGLMSGRRSGKISSSGPRALAQPNPPYRLCSSAANNRCSLPSSA
jgi:hypothetical protein